MRPHDLPVYQQRDRILGCERGRGPNRDRDHGLAVAGDGEDLRFPPAQHDVHIPQEVKMFMFIRQAERRLFVEMLVIVRRLLYLQSSTCRG